jgi:hypothetical protein
MSGESQSGPISTPFNDISGAMPGVWDWMKNAGTTIKNIADENPTWTKWITFGVGAFAGITWGGELADAFFRNFPKLDNFFTRLIVHGLAIFAGLAGANALSSWLTNRPGAVEHREQVAAETKAHDAQILAQRDQVMLANGFNPRARQVDRSQSDEAVLRQNRDNRTGVYTVPDGARGPTGDHPKDMNYGQQSVPSRTYAYAGGPNNGPDWTVMPDYYGRGPTR